MKGIRTILIVLIVVGLAAPVAVSDSDSLTIQYQFNAVQGDGRYGPLLIEDTLLREIPGEPVIPYYTAQILLPQGTEIKDVKVKTSVPVEQTGYDIPWGQPPSIFGDTPEKVSKNEEIYNSNQWYPQEIYEVISTESFRGFQILLVNLYPVQYQPKSGTVKFYETLTVEVKVKKDQKSAQTGAGGEPGIDVRETNTVLIVESGRTVVIGGIYEETINIIKSGVPFFSDIPGFGRLFTNTYNKKELTELLIFLTTTIVPKDIIGIESTG